MNHYENSTSESALTFSSLPRDLKLEIFDFVRSKCDQGNARLVSREWARLMRPRMWKNIATSLQVTFARDPCHLLDEQRACFQEIRELTVGARHVRSDYHDCFSDFMRRLRNNQLHEFSSARETPLNWTQPLGLLRHQSNLRSFRARLDFSGAAIEDIQGSLIELAALSITALRSLKFLRIYIGNRNYVGTYSQKIQDHEMNCCRLLVKAARTIDCLHICGWGRTWSKRVDRIPLTILFGDAENPEPFPGMLRSLLFSDMDLSGAENKLFRTVNFAHLNSLKLEYCDNLSLFLHMLATSIQRTGARLKVLTIRTRTNEIAGDNDGIEEGVKNLLCSFAGLEELELDFLLSFAIDWRASLGAHRTVKKLLASAPSMCDGSPFWADKIAHILEQCPNLEHFAYVPDSFPLGYVADCQFPSSLTPRLYDSLDVVAVVPTIRILRLMYAPDLWEDRINRQDITWIEKAGQLAHSYANLVLKHLYSKGSNIRMLALAPNSRWKHARGDSNLHYYPYYFYKLRVVEVDTKRVIEIQPLRDYVAECPDAEIFM